MGQGLSLGALAGLLLLVVVTSGSLPSLLATPEADATLGALNQCLAGLVRGPRLGWAVAPDGQRAAALGPREVGVCGPGPARLRLEVAGATHATFDAQGRLWVGAGGRLWREEAGRLRAVGDFTPAALAGHAGGVLALGAGGQLVSVAPDGAVRALVALPEPGGALSVGPGGVLAALVLGGEVRAWEASTLTPLRAAPPCRQVEALWWLGPDSVLLGCGPQDALALTFNLRTGESELAPRGPRAASHRLLSRPLHVQDCEGLPCTAPAPRVVE